MPTAHLICGSTGAGKTTYAIALAGRIKGVRFSIEHWMSTLFLPDRSGSATVEWAVERMRRCEAQIWSVAEQVIASGRDVVLDVGLSRLQDRDRWRALVAGTRAESKLHYLDVGKSLRRTRVLTRNQQLAAGTHAFAVSESMFDHMEGWFEPPSDDELYGAMIICEDAP
jgi:predicted kinase